MPVKDFKWVEDISEFHEDFIESYNNDSDKGYFLEVDVQCPENLHKLHNDLLFLPKRMKIEKVEKFAANWHDKTETVIHIRNLKQELVLEEVHRTIKFNQKAWLIWTQRSWWITVFEKTMENVRKCRTIKLATTEQKEETSWYENNLSYKKNFLWKPIRNRNEKNTDIMNKS